MDRRLHVGDVVQHFKRETITEEARMRMETLRSIDSEHLATFDDIDRHYLEQICQLIG